MHAYDMNLNALSERQLRSFVRQSILFEYRETQRVRLINEGIFDFFSGIGDAIMKPIKSAVGAAVAKMLKITDKAGYAYKAVMQFFEKVGIKDLFNIVMGQKGCEGTLLLFANGLINLIVRDIPNVIGLDPKGGFTKKLQGVFGEPAKDMAKKLAAGLCAIKWSMIMSAVPGLSTISSWFGGGKKEDEKPSHEEVKAELSGDKEAIAAIKKGKEEEKEG